MTDRQAIAIMAAILFRDCEVTSHSEDQREELKADAAAMRAGLIFRACLMDVQAIAEEEGSAPASPQLALPPDFLFALKEPR